MYETEALVARHFQEWLLSLSIKGIDGVEFTHYPEDEPDKMLPRYPYVTIRSTLKCKTDCQQLFYEAWRFSLMFSGDQIITMATIHCTLPVTGLVGVYVHEPDSIDTMKQACLTWFRLVEQITLAGLANQDACETLFLEWQQGFKHVHMKGGTQS